MHGYRNKGKGMRNFQQMNMFVPLDPSTKAHKETG